MANPDHLNQLQQGADRWNAWRQECPSSWVADFSKAELHGANLRDVDLRGADLHGADLSRMHFSDANLSGADLSDANLRGADLRWADLSEANLFRANLREANLEWATLRRTKFERANLCRASLRRTNFDEASLGSANFGGADLSQAVFSRTDFCGVDFHKASLREADLRGANLCGANLCGVNLRGAKLGKADLSGAKLGGADLRLANIIGIKLNKADLSGAKLWEAQHSHWEIKEIICENVFWDKEGKESTEYGKGDFERIFAERPRMILRFPGGVLPIDLLALPLMVERLQAEHPGSALRISSVQDDANGASVTITVDDLAGRSAEAFGQELVRLQTKLECIVEERDHLRRRLGAVLSEGISKVAEFLALPRQEIHVHRPSGSVAIEGFNMNRDTYNISGQAGAVGPDAHAHDNTFQQVQGGIDLPKLAGELGRLRDAMKAETTGTREQDKAIGAVADAEEAAARGDGPAVLRYLKGAGGWALGIAEKIGVAAAIEALKQSI